MSEATQVAVPNFEKALRNQYRYTTPGIGGVLATEDLFKLSLKQLDATAVNLSDEVETTGKKSLITESTAANTLAQAKLDIVVYIIRQKQAEAAAAKTRAANKAREQAILELLAKKREQADGEKSEEDLLKELKELQNQD